MSKPEIVRAILNLAVATAGCLVALHLFSALNPPWVQFYSINAEWIADREDPYLRISFQLYKNEACKEVQVRKNLSRVVEEGEVLPTPIVLNGALPMKLRNAPLGHSTISDDARPRTDVQPGEYQLVLLASCVPEDPGPEQTKQAAATSRVLKDADIIRVNISVGRFSEVSSLEWGFVEWPF